MAQNYIKRIVFLGFQLLRTFWMHITLLVILDANMKAKTVPRFPKPQDRPGSVHRRLSFWFLTYLLVQLGSLVGDVRPSCPTWLLLGSNLVHLCSNLAQLSANLAQLGAILAQLGSNFGPILVPTWSNMVPKSDQDELQEMFSSFSKQSSVSH